MADANVPAFWEPKAISEPSRGLFSVVEVHEGIDPHLLMGVQYDTTRCTTGGYWDAICEAVGQTKTFGGTYNIVGYGAAVYDGVKCLPVGTDFSKIQTQLQDSLRPKAEFAAEKLLINSLTSDSTGFPPTGTVVDMVAASETRLAQEYGGLGALHMNLWTATHAAANNLLIEPANGSDVVHTIAGTPVVIGRGYSGGFGLLVGVTGHVSVLLGPVVEVTTPPNLKNEIVTMVEQQFVVVAECESTVIPEAG